ncbi:MAG: sigma-54-dependent transcriptional regulator [Halanaerobium sp.]
MQQLKTKPLILIIDDEEAMADSLAKNLLNYQYRAETMAPAEFELDYFKENDVSVVLLDMKLGKMSGLKVLQKIKDNFPETEVIIITGFASMDNAIEAIKLGAFDYLEKPLDLAKLNIIISNALKLNQLVKENKELKNAQKGDKIIAESKEMEKVKYMIERLKDTNTTVLITGESGTGKELVAKALHQQSVRREQEMISVNCAAMPESLLESELFGFKKGAFTNADRDHRGKFKQADQGTLFLDEIGDLSLKLQAKLLRVIQEKSFVPLGSEKKEKVDVRIIAASNQNLKKLIAEDKFREDLYYRIAVVEINIPPLRKRKEDIPLLLYHFFNLYKNEYQRQLKGFTSEFLELINNYSFPGNVRELKNIVERAVLLSTEDKIDVDLLPQDILSVNSNLKKNDFTKYAGLKDFLDKQEKIYLNYYLEKSENKKEAAAKLDISRKTLYKKIKKHDLDL